MGKTVSAVVKLIDRFTSPSKQVKQSAKNLEARFKHTGENIKAIGSVFESAGKSMTKAVTVPVLGAGAAATKFASESQDAFQQFAAATGTGTDAMEQYKDTINEVYKSNFGESITDVADGLAKVKQNMGGLSGKELESVTKYAYGLRDTFGAELAESTRAADALMKHFGTSAKESFNLMTQGAQNGLDFSGELLDNIDEYSVQFKKMGLGAEDMFSIFANGAENGAWNLDKIGDAVKEFSIRSIDGSDSTAAGFQALGMDADDMAAKLAKGGKGARDAFNQTITGLAKIKDPVKQNAAGVALFGTMWEDLGPQVVTSLTTANAAIDKTKDSAEQMVNVKYDTLSAAMGGMWRTVQTDVLQPIGKMLIPYVETAIDKIGDLTDWWNTLGEGTQKNIVKFALIGASVGPALLGIGKLTTGIGNTITTIGKVGGAVKKLGGAMKVLKFAGALGGIGALVTAGVLVYKNWDKISAVFGKAKDAVVKFGSGVKEKAKGAKDALVKFAGSVKQDFADAVHRRTDQVKGFFGGAKDYIKNNFYKGAKSGLDKAGDAVKEFRVRTKERMGAAKETFKGALDYVKGGFKTGWKKAWGGARDIFKDAFGAIPGLAKKPMNGVIGILNKAIGGINKLSFTMPDWFPIGAGKTFGVHIPTITPLAKGTQNWKGGLAQISERGGEIVDLPKGSRVYPHDKSIHLARQEAKQPIILNIAKIADEIIVREKGDIKEIVEQLVEELVRRIEQVQPNMA